MEASMSLTREDLEGPMSLNQEDLPGPMSLKATPVQDIFISSLQMVAPSMSLSDISPQSPLDTPPKKRDLSLPPKFQSRLPVRRDSSSPPSLPSSGRSTPLSFQRPPMQREASSPAGLMSSSQKQPRPPIPPKPTHAKLKRDLSLPTGINGVTPAPYKSPTGRSGVRPVARPGAGPGPAPPKKECSDLESVSGRSTPASLSKGQSKIPRPHQLKKWESTSNLEMRRRSSDLTESSLRKRALTASSSVNLSRSVSASSSNLARSISSSSFSSMVFSNRSKLAEEAHLQRKATAEENKIRGSGLKKPASANKKLASPETTAKRTDAAKTKDKTEDGDFSLLREELDRSRKLVETLRQEVEQKENIAALAVTGGQDFEIMYRELNKEHSSLVSASKMMEERNAKIEEELQEARDQAELLEFRLLEMEQRESRERSPEVGRKLEAEDGGRGDGDSLSSFTLDSGCASSTTLDELLEVQRDFRNEKIVDTKTKLHQLMNHIPEPSGKSLLLQTVALFETLLSKIQSMKTENEALAAENVDLGAVIETKRNVETEMETTKKQKQEADEGLHETLQKLFSSEQRLEQFKLEAEKKETASRQMYERQLKIEADLKKEVQLAQNQLESARMGHQSESEMYQKSMEKASLQERRVKELEAKVSELQKNNEELTNNLRRRRRSSVSSAEFSGEEKLSLPSKYTHTKAPSVLSDSSDDHIMAKTNGTSSGVVSDLSDSENDSSDPGHGTPSKDFMHKEQLIESGIFDEVNAMDRATQTLETCRQITCLNEEIGKLTKFRDMVERQDTSPLTSKSNSPSLGKVSEYGSCEELEKINGAGRYDHRAEIELLSNKLKDMENKWEHLYAEHQTVVEEKCELEEAENDSRLRAQTLEVQYAGALERSQVIKEELIHERHTSEELKMQLEEYMNREERNMDDIESLQIHVQQQEQTIRDLEDREMYYAEQLHLLDMGVKISSWWSTWAWLVAPQEEGTPDGNMVDAMDLNERQEAKDIFKDQLASVSSIKADYDVKEAQLSEKIWSLQTEFDAFIDDMVVLLWGSPQSEMLDRKEKSLEKVKNLLLNVTHLKKQINDLEKKETAYSKTIQEADTIMARVEYSYQERIKDLEQEKHNLREKILYFEENESKLKQNLRVAGKGEMQKVTELLGKLAETEKNELIYKERVLALEACEQELSRKLMERETDNEKIRAELKDQDELVKRVCDMDTENQELSTELSRLKDVEHKLNELRKTEELLRKRFEELEESEQKLKNNLESSDMAKQKVEQKYKDTVSALKEEITTKNTSVTKISSEADDLRDKDEMLTKQVHTLKLQIKDLEGEVETKSAELESIESSYRSELHKARQQLVRSNDRLTNLDQLNSQLQNQLFDLEKKIKNYLKEFEALKHREEQNTIQWNLLIAEKDSQILSLCDQIETLSMKVNSHELDILADSEAGLAHLSREMCLTTRQIKGCQACGDITTAKLEEISDQLASLTHIVLGRQADQEELDEDDEDSSYERGLGHPTERGLGHPTALGNAGGAGRHVSLDSGLGYCGETSTQDLCRCESDEMIPMLNKKDDGGALKAAGGNQADISQSKEDLNLNIKDRYRNHTVRDITTPARDMHVWNPTTTLPHKPHKNMSISDDDLRHNITTEHRIHHTTLNEPLGGITTQASVQHIQTDNLIQNTKTDNINCDMRADNPPYHMKTVDAVHNIEMYDSIQNTKTIDPLHAMSTYSPNHKTVPASPGTTKQTSCFIARFPNTFSDKSTNTASASASPANQDNHHQQEHEALISQMRTTIQQKDEALTKASAELMDLCKKMQEVSDTNVRQMSEISRLTQHIGQLQKPRPEPKATNTASGPSSFIIKDLQSQIQQLEDKNVKKDFLIKKLAELILKTPEMRIPSIVDSIRDATCKPSDRRIDFNIETLCCFLEKRRLSGHSQHADPFRVMLKTRQ